MWGASKQLAWFCFTAHPALSCLASASASLCGAGTPPSGSALPPFLQQRAAAAQQYRCKPPCWWLRAVWGCSVCCLEAASLQTGGRAARTCQCHSSARQSARFRGEVACERQRQLSLLIYDWAGSGWWWQLAAQLSRRQLPLPVEVVAEVRRTCCSCREAASPPPSNNSAETGFCLRMTCAPSVLPSSSRLHGGGTAEDQVTMIGAA